MLKLELSIDREIDFMNKYGLTPDELFLIKLIFYAQENHPEYMSKFFSVNSLTKEIIEVLKSLQTKGIITKAYRIPNKGEVFEPNDVVFNKLLINGFFQHSEDMGMELFYNYPSDIVINGKHFSLRNITKCFKNIDDMCFSYGKAIKFNPIKHKEVMELLEYGKEHNLIHYGIGEFIEGRQWESLKEFQEGDNIGMELDTTVLV